MCLLFGEFGGRISIYIFILFGDWHTYKYVHMWISIYILLLLGENAMLLQFPIPYKMFLLLHHTIYHSKLHCALLASLVGHIHIFLPFPYDHNGLISKCPISQIQVCPSQRRGHEYVDTCCFPIKKE